MSLASPGVSSAAGATASSSFGVVNSDSLVKRSIDCTICRLGLYRPKSLLLVLGSHSAKMLLPSPFEEPGFRESGRIKDAAALALDAAATVVRVAAWTSCCWQGEVMLALRR
jgi:hypothetical protein